MLPVLLLCFVAIVAYADAQLHVLPGYAQRHPTAVSAKTVQDPREMIWDRNVGRGKIFGTLGSTDDSLFGKAGFKQNIFDDHRGKLGGEAYGSRVLTDYGGSSVLGGKLDWSNSNDNVRVALDLHKEIGRGSGMTLTGDGVWKVDKNIRLVAEGEMQKTFGHSKPEFGVHAKIEHDFK